MQFNCLPWHGAPPNKHFEPELALRGAIVGVFGGTFALPDMLTHVMCREASGSTKGQRDYGSGLSSTLWSSPDRPCRILQVSEPCVLSEEGSVTSGLLPPERWRGFGVVWPEDHAGEEREL